MNNKQQQILVSFRKKPVRNGEMECGISTANEKMRMRTDARQHLGDYCKFDFRRKRMPKYMQLGEQQNQNMKRLRRKNMRAIDEKQDSKLPQKLGLLVCSLGAEPSLLIIPHEDIDKILKKYQQSIECIFVSSQIFTQNILHGSFFIDKKFSPFLSSLYGCKNCRHRIKQWKNIIWQKISSVWPNCPLFYQQGKVQELIRGQLGNRYFLIGVSALVTKNFNNISNLFVKIDTKTENCYLIRILYKGRWQILVLDDYVPCMDDKPAFNSTKNHELWLILLEKAWAKLYGSYSHIESGFIEEPLHDLTGAPVQIIFLKKKEISQIWSYLSSKEAQDYAIVANSQESKNTEIQSPNGILYDFSYYLLGVYQLKQKNGPKHHKIVKLKCETEKFRGRWSDFDPIWISIPQEEKQRIGYARNMDDGVFFMDFEEFVYDFNHLISAEIIKNASYISQTCLDKQSVGCYYKIEVYSEGSYSLQVDKTPQRKFICNSSQSSNYKYPKTQLELYKLTTDSLSFVSRSHSSNKRRSLFHKMFLVPGTYFTYVKTAFNPEFEQDFETTLAVYSSKAVSIQIPSQYQTLMLKHQTQKLKQIQINTLATKQVNPEKCSQNRLLDIIQLTKKTSNQPINYSSSISTESPLHTSKTQSFTKNQNQSNKSSFIKKNDKSSLSVGGSILDEYTEQGFEVSGPLEISDDGYPILTDEKDSGNIDEQKQKFSDSSLSSSSIIYQFDDQPLWVQYDHSPLEQMNQQSSIILYANHPNYDPSTIYEVSSSRQQSSIKDPLPLAPNTSLIYQPPQTFNNNNSFNLDQQLQQSFYVYVKDKKDDNGDLQRQ